MEEQKKPKTQEVVNVTDPNTGYVYVTDHHNLRIVKCSPNWS